MKEKTINLNTTKEELSTVPHKILSIRQPATQMVIKVNEKQGSSHVRKFYKEIN